MSADEERKAAKKNTKTATGKITIKLKNKALPVLSRPAASDDEHVPTSDEKVDDAGVEAGAADAPKEVQHALASGSSA